MGFKDIDIIGKNSVLAVEDRKEEDNFAFITQKENNNWGVYAELDNKVESIVTENKEEAVSKFKNIFNEYDLFVSDITGYKENAEDLGII